MKITLILDPSILFQFYNKNYYIHPIIRNWLSSVKSNENVNELHLYLLSKKPGLPHIHINPTLNLPMNALFFDLLSSTAYEYMKELWGNFIPLADMSSDAPLGISKFNGNHQPSKDEIVVVTADDDICSLFTKKGISVAKLDKANYPITTCLDTEKEPLDILNTIGQNDAEVYCDFDGTLFDFHNYSLLAHIKKYLSNHAECLPENNALKEMMNKSDYPLINENTVAFLKHLKKYPTYLITQRKYEIDSMQPALNCAEKIVSQINEKNQLNIQARKSSFLNAVDQLSKTNTCTKKIEHLYSKILYYKYMPKPKHIILIDDSFAEHVKIEKSKPYFADLNIKVTPILIFNSMYYSESNMEIIQKYIPSFFVKISELASKEQNKLEIAINSIKNKQNPTFHVYNRNSLFSPIMRSNNVRQHESKNSSNFYLQAEKKDALKNRMGQW